MGSRWARLGLLAAAVLAAAALAASASAALRVLVLRSGNHTDSNRTARTIDRVVIHATEGRFVGSVRWLRNPRSRGSSHFVVSRGGQIVQLVSVTDVAWHAGNVRWNRHSIGIEHEGWTRRGGFTEAEYRSSAKLVAYLARRYGIPLDRGHVVGHNEVPNPRRRGMLGGVDGHSDPGSRWRWGHYMRLVHRYARHPDPPRFTRRGVLVQPRLAVPAAPRQPRPLRRRSVVDRRAVVRGSALWWSGIDAARRWRRGIYKVEFLVDGRVLWVDRRWPFSFRAHRGWDTRTVADGRHMLVVRAYGRRGYRSRKSVPVRVDNPPLRLAVEGAYDGVALGGTAAIDVRPTERVRRVALYVDGRPVSRDGTAPYHLVWDTTAASEGPHELLVYARGAKRRAAVRLQVAVANATTFPSSLMRQWPTDG